MMVALPLSVAMPIGVTAQATWTIAATPAVRVGIGPSDDDILAAPAGASRLPNGNLVVGDVSGSPLRLFSPAGRYLKRIARKGKGPGEIEYLAPLLRCGDSLVANDIAGSASVYQLDGTFVRAFRFSPQPYRLNCNAQMRFIVMGWASNKDHKDGAFRPLVEYTLVSADSTRPISLGRLPGGDRFGTTGGERPLPLGREPRVAVGPTRAYVAMADSFAIAVFDLNGKPLAPLVARVPRVEATKQDLVAEREREIAMMGERARSYIERDYAALSPPKYLPATRDLIVDADANLWVQHFPRAASATVPWTVFGTDGKIRATVTLPAALELYEVGRDYVLGRYIDPNESIPEVRMYRLTRR